MLELPHVRVALHQRDQLDVAGTKARRVLGKRLDVSQDQALKGHLLPHKGAVFVAQALHFGPKGIRDFGRKSKSSRRRRRSSTGRFILAPRLNEREDVSPAPPESWPVCTYSRFSCEPPGEDIAGPKCPPAFRPPPIPCLEVDATLALLPLGAGAAIAVL